MGSAVNPFAELENAWEKYTETFSLFLSVQYRIIMIMLITVFLKYGGSEFSCRLLAAVFMDLYEVVDRKRIQKIYKLRSLEMKLMMKNACRSY